MTLGFILWASVTFFLLGFWGWTTFTLYQQKTAWKAYAKKNQLRYRPNRMLDSGEVSGSLDGYQVTMFATDHGIGDVKSRRVMSTIEISLKSSLPTACAVASGGMVKLVEELGLTQEYRPDSPDWDVSFIARSREEEILKTYLTNERIRLLSKVMKRQRSWTILIFAEHMGLLRMDTSDPLESFKKVDTLLRELITVAKALELASGEDKIIASKRRDNDQAKQKVLRVDENVLSENFGLSLDEDI